MGKKNPIGFPFVALIKPILDSKAWKELKPTSKIGFIGFLRDKKNNQQTEVVLTLSQAQQQGICSSPATFSNLKKELVEKGFLDPFNPGGLNEPAVFELSNRWKWYGTKRFENVAYKPGVGSKYFAEAWKDENKSKKILKARYGKT